ncbi:CBS domain-containing protein [Streptomyces sp. NPDC088732]|uniref:CBS domain-containing protein n=1 Tax=Streptomyces sp. NPDC088732 TaxID=3365879 RepID=UPI00380358E3
MHHRNVGDLMTKAVVSVRRDTSFKDIAQKLTEHEITAVPVVDDDGRPVGVVSEADLLRKEAGQLDPSGLLPPPHPRPRPQDRARIEATTAEGLMSSPVVLARPEWSVVEAARVMERRNVKRLPVVDEAGRLVGVVSRADLLQLFLRRDHAIAEEITGDVLVRTLGMPLGAVTVTVTDGKVSLDGVVDRKSLIPVVTQLCRGVDGVVDVHARLGYKADDTARPAAARR